MAGGLGDVLGLSFVLMPRIFGEFVPPEPEPGTVVTLSGIPAPARKRHRDVADVEGYGRQPVIGAGKLTAEAAISGVLDIDSIGGAYLIAEAAPAAVLAIRVGAEAVLASEWGINAMMLCAARGTATLATEALTAGVIMALADGASVMRRGLTVSGYGTIRTGGEARLQTEENEDALILAAAHLIQKLLST